MNYKLMFKGDYIAAVEFGGKHHTLTIKGVKLVRMEDDAGRQKNKGVVFFCETDRGWVLCRTNAICLAAMFGEETNGWPGKRVTLFAMDVQVGKEKQPGIRVLGSPDLERPMKVPVKLPRKKAFTMTMQVTKPGAAPAAEEQADDAAQAIAEAATP